MTEDDTFRKLKQSPFIVVYNAIFADGAIHGKDIMAAHHWTYDEYMVALNARFPIYIYPFKMYRETTPRDPIGYP